ncbi:hypothetical protein Saro_1303 [Novosphingobium aromaticivorans DSM 12444]|uniref:Outer membrane protein beta-barrel domain-containing protein n=1 Tax=Novosphingobium aromaticivorans (strain ATCC 700278 / DSM 12444 / CCUG 56034 / CIP 105152 / NBRC 16084 / F199) TaxID=279238 RepID=Q2G8S6_NOVAD|nr:porin family protein [Novosphingobium aromaticivorans]ABD25747.1 hypothetical protein Saro_1303 [Novosphingobium aromaticivorans DSM 12444]SCY02503.1 outer membrane immunogenic protein [Novosphingobium aromaticivorans]
MRLVLLSLAASLVAATPALAAGDAGAYVGVGVTHDNLASSGDDEGVGINGVGGTVFAGYNFDLTSSVYAGVEANFDLATAKIGDDTDSLEADYAFGGSALLGFRPSDSTALYGRVGYQRGRGTLTVDGTEYSDSADGLRLGLGLQADLTEKLGVRVEYNHTHYYGENGSTGLNNNQAAVSLVYGF